MSGGARIPHFPSPAPIEAYGNGGFRFADMSHRGSLLCLPDGIWAWDVVAPDIIDAPSLVRVIALAGRIDTLILGTGSDVWIAPQTLRAELRNRKIVLDTMLTGPAIRTYNVMLSEGRRVAAALIAVP
ncbi:MAG TPA: MTH938/NDUFAF3 family protein [Afipia sp.]